MEPIEQRVRKVMAEIEDVSTASIDLYSSIPGKLAAPLLRALTSEFGDGIVQNLLVHSVRTVADLVDLILPAMDAGPRWCRCSKGDWEGEGKDGADCPVGCGGKLICRVL
jgi:hypothetical protein